MSEKKVIRVGSRKSELALIQTNHVISCLKNLYPSEEFEIHKMNTVGDRILNVSLPKIGEKALFTRDLEEALSNGTVDFVVHSLKDLPTSLPDGMAIGAILMREDPRDALVLNAKYANKTLATLPNGAVIGTSSLRRTAQLARSYPHLMVQDIRGNLNTRLDKLDAENSKFAGIILARAGLVRMGWHKRISQTLEPDDLLYAVGQGALAVECRSTDMKILKMLRKLTCILTQSRILAERSFLKTLGGGCSAPVAVKTILKRRSGESMTNSYELSLTGAVWSLDGKKEIQGTTQCLLDIVDDDIVDETPKKKIKLDDDYGPTNVNLNIVDETPSTSSISADAPLNLDHLLKVHEEVIGKNDSNSENTIDKSSDDDFAEHHLTIPVGQDFMGQCPYLSSAQKIQATKDDQINHNIDCQTKGCPFLRSKTVRAVKEPPPAKQVCPFLDSMHTTDKSDLKLNKTQSIDADKNLIKQSQDGHQSKIDGLFCGLFAHETMSCDLLERCDALGRSLAINLIENGALKVMEAAQQEIRKNM